MTLPAWDARLREAARAMSVPDMTAIFAELSTAHGGTPSTAVKTRALRVLREVHAGRPENVYQLALSLATAEHPAGQELAAILLAEQYAAHPAEVAAGLCQLADSPHWEVREWAASACGLVLSGHFGPFYPVLEAWTRNASPNVRRAVALAAMYAGKDRTPDRGDLLLDLVEPLLPDRDPYVRTNLGRFAIGSGLLRYYPTATLARLERWAQSADEQVRWNVAMAFAAAEGARHAAEARAVLARLADDGRRSVRQAVRTALRNLEKRGAGHSPA